MLYNLLIMGSQLGNFGGHIWPKEALGFFGRTFDRIMPHVRPRGQIGRRVVSVRAFLALL